jgi:hypothetical protein
VVTRTVPLVSPLRGGEVGGTIEVRLPSSGVPAVRPAPRPPLPSAEAPEPRSVAVLGAEHEEPPLPDEARLAVVAAAAPDEATRPVVAAPGQSLHVHFGLTPAEALARAFEELRAVIAEHPGETPVVLHLPVSGGRVQAMQLRSGVAYDTELLAEIGRRLRAGLVTLELE